MQNAGIFHVRQDKVEEGRYDSLSAANLLRHDHECPRPNMFLVGPFVMRLFCSGS